MSDLGKFRYIHFIIIIIFWEETVNSHTAMCLMQLGHYFTP